jgi:hypothetical protein
MRKLKWIAMVWWKTTQQHKERMTSTIATTETTEPMVTTRQPVIRLTQEERQDKCLEHEYGICDSCDTGLDAPDDFVSSVVAYELHVRCISCYHYYAEEESIARMCGFSDFDEFSF